MTQHITQEQAVDLATRKIRAESGPEYVHELCNAAIQHYLDQHKAELPVLQKGGSEMTTPNEELIARAKRLRNELDDSNARLDRQCVTAMYEMGQALQSQAERIKELELDLDIQAGSIEAVQAANSRLAAERDTLRAQLAETEPVFYEYQWTNPGNQPHQPESMFVWARVEPAWNGTVQQKVDELLAYRYDDKPIYRVRALFTHPMPAQGVEASMIKLPEPVELNPAANSVRGHSDATLKQAVRDALDTQGVEDAARYRWLRDYLISPSTHFDDLIISADKAETLNGVIDAARAKGAN